MYSCMQHTFQLLYYLAMKWGKQPPEHDATPTIGISVLRIRKLPILKHFFHAKKQQKNVFFHFSFLP